jgi:inhibitor of KinA sporulation pathway (predicted exonuclease)
MPPEFIAVLDFEANCLEGALINPQEIIEFPVVIYDVAARAVDRARIFHSYCRPVSTRLSPFCTELTGITQATCDAAPPFPAVLKAMQRWMYDSGLIDDAGQSKALFATVGNWDLETALPAQCALSKVKAPACLRTWCDVKTVFRAHTGAKPGGMLNMLTHFGMTLEGRHHSGIDDCLNTARIVDALVRTGAEFAPTASR